MEDLAAVTPSNLSSRLQRSNNLHCSEQIPNCASIQSLHRCRAQRSLPSSLVARKTQSRAGLLNPLLICNRRSNNTVGCVESGERREEYHYDVCMMCAVFNLPYPVPTIPPLIRAISPPLSLSTLVMIGIQAVWRGGDLRLSL